MKKKEDYKSKIMVASVVAGFLLPCINHEKLRYLKQFLSFFKFKINAIIRTAQKTALSETLDKLNLYKRNVSAKSLQMIKPLQAK